ncbi:MAG: hypothetical protein RIB45_07140 [Marivibrio sp.]|uniref:hypothetical protein n=1 Tax=Marivibrio sp. TaxID=2039719 RepID=UPI0032EB0529
MYFRALALLLALLSAVACGPVPKPFAQPAPVKAENPLLAMPDSIGVTVAPPIDGPSDLTGPLAERTAERLRWAGVPASTGPGLSGGYLLEGRTRLEGGRAIVAWRLTDPSGETTAAPEVSAPARRGEYEAGADALLAALSKVSASAVAEALASPSARALADPAADAGPDRADAIFVMGVEGPAPGPAEELNRALAALLEDLGAPLTGDEGAATLLIQGAYAVAPGEGDAEGVRLSVDWWLLAPDGSVVGTLSQENAVPDDPSRTGFGPLAYDIAYPVADAVARSLQAE